MQDEVKNILQNQYNNHIMPFLWLAGENQEVLRNYMLKIHECHIHSVVIESRTHPDFLQEKWWQDLDCLIDVAKELGMKIWILDDYHFPTGAANGALISKYPERKKTLLYYKCIDVLGPAKSIGISTYVNDATQKILGIYAKKNNEIIDLSKMKDQDIIYFDVPEGRWKVFVIYTTEQSQFREEYINMVDYLSCQTLIEEVYEPHYQRYHSEFGKTIAGFFSDEPGFMNEKGLKNDSAIGKDMMLPWSDELAQCLEEELGQDYILKLSCLWDDDAKSAYIRYVFMDQCTKLYQKNFCDQLGNWCRERHVEYIGHIIEDRDSHARLGVGSGHFYRAMKGQDMAGLDIVLNQLIPGMDEGMHSTFRGTNTWDNEFFHYVLGKMGSSLAYIDAKKKGRTVAEVFGAFGWSEGLKMMKWIADAFFVRGTNYFVPHAFSPKTFPDTDCPPHFYAHGNNPQFRYFKDLMLYMNKMSTLFSGGVTKPKISILYHAESEWCGKYMLTQKVTKELTRRQIDFDIIPNDIFSKENPYQSAFDDVLHVNTQNYECLIIPYSEYITNDLYEFIMKTKESSFQVIFIQDYPTHILNGNDCLLEQIKEISKCVAINELQNYVLDNHVYRIQTSDYQPYLRYHHYFKENREYIMFFNEDPKKEIHTHILYPTNHSIYQLDVLHNEIHQVEYTDQFPVSLSPYQSLIYVVGDICQDIPTKKQHQYTQWFEIKTPYRLSIATSQNYPQFHYQKELFELENMSLQKHCPDFSGTFRYVVEWNCEKDIHDALIDLGDVYEIADLYINDLFIGTRICPPYTFQIKDILKVGINKLTIDVTNTLDKQVKDLISLGEEIKPSGLLNWVKVYY